ncbi:PREDICTED: pre-mRNA-splicing factor Slu7-like isoform X1 [Dinoponera quadriceps]|uniref:Pre-mRNA-splicing factor Slu7-like isoform X1 n=1 Tax=Dinoponera quadriceps TaxID=609295 RepID=A0A6P3WQL1_DINQU|nr:PREDICTED: pre-mRNA-splicing factor Slu7-like isoform X1 [Dinoponera quadriceps]
MANSLANVTVSTILKNKSSFEDEPRKKSREDWRKAKELEEARKAGDFSFASLEGRLMNASLRGSVPHAGGLPDEGLPRYVDVMSYVYPLLQGHCSNVRCATRCLRDPRNGSNRAATRLPCY